MADNKLFADEKSVCTCDRCGRVMEKDVVDGEWQERLIIAFRGGFGSVFGDGNLVEGSFCQECIQLLLGKWLRITNDNPFEQRHKLANDPEKGLQPYQSKMQEIDPRVQTTIVELFLASRDLWGKNRELAERLGVSEDQVVSIAFDHLLQATESNQTRQTEG